MGILKTAALFSLGGSGYVGLELLWRGRSHGSMLLAGGVCFLLLGQLQTRLAKLSLPVRGMLGAGIITAVELVTGLIFNRTYQVWDYRGMPFQFLGHICLPFTLLWLPVSLFAMALYRHAVKLLEW